LIRRALSRRAEPARDDGDFPSPIPKENAMADKNQIQGEGNYDAARRYQKEQHDFARSGKVDRKAHEAEDALDGPEGEDLERARRETGDKPM
jgi:hypothetical protein